MSAEKAPLPPENSKTAEGLTHEERKHVNDAKRHRAAVVYEIIRLQGETELRRPVTSLWYSGVAAGISIGFSFLTEAALAAHLPHAEWTAIIAKLGYAVGFLIVILGHQQLFTENVLTAVLPVISRRSGKWLLRMLRLWGIVLAANIVGCFIFSWFFAKAPVLDPDVQAEMAKIVSRLMGNTAWEMFAKGIGAGWMIAALVWILSASDGVEFPVITLATFLIALFGFTHIVAGTAEVAYGYLQHQLTARQGIFDFFLPTLCGNVFGGTILFSALSHGQVREEIVVRQPDGD